MNSITITQFRNIIAFLCLMMHEEPSMQDELLRKSPDYILEKFTRYIGTTINPYNDYEWGIHPLLFRLLTRYEDQWEEQLKALFENYSKYIEKTDGIF